MSTDSDVTRTQAVVLSAEPADPCQSEQVSAFICKAADAIRYAADSSYDSQIPLAEFSDLRNEMVTTFGKSPRTRRALIHAGLMLLNKGLMACANQFFDLALIGMRGEAQEKAQRALRSYLEKSQAAVTKVGPVLTPPPSMGVGFKK